MKRIALFLFFGIASITLSAQNGKLEVVVNNDYADGEIKYDLVVNLWLNDSLVSTSDDFDYTLFENLEAGVYRIEVFAGEKKVLSYDYAVVEPGSTSYIQLELPTMEVTNDSLPKESDAYMEFVMPLRFSFKTIEDNPYAIKREIGFGYEYNLIIPITRHIAVYNNSGSSVYFYKVNAESDLTWGAGKERFFKWTLSEGLFFRFSVPNIRRAPITGLIFDMGAVYHFPLLMNYTYFISDNFRHSVGRIHRYNDVSVMVRIGYAPLVVFAEYNLFDYVKQPYPQMPKLRFGVSVQVPMN